MTAEILSVGTELLLGQIVNTDTQFLSRRLSAIGVSVYHTQVVGDNLARLEEALRLAMSRSDMVIVTGGLGPTDDDITKRAVSRVADVPLTMCDEAEKRIRDYMARTNREVNEANLRQAMLPKGCKVLLNDFGTAPGCVVNCENKLIILLPGPPRELEPMFVNQVEPILASQSKNVIVSKYLRIFGMSEAAVQEKLADLFAGSSPTVSPYAKSGEVELRITACAETAERANAICEPVAEEITARLGHKVYTDKYDSLQETVVRMLKENGQSVATAESCTGGLLSKRITEIPGASDIFSLGLCTYSAEEKTKRLGVKAETIQKYGVVSYQVAMEMAEGVRLISGASVGIGITGVAGPDTDEKGTPVGTVFIALSDSISVYCREVRIGRGKDERELVRTVASSHALDMLRLFAEGKYEAIGTAFPIPEVGAVGTAENSEESQAKKKLTLWQKFIHFFTDFPSDPVGEKIRKSIMSISIIALIVALGFIGEYCYNMLVSDQSVNKATKLEQRANEMTTEEEMEIREELVDKIGFNEANSVQKWTLELLKENSDLVGKVSIDGLMDYYVTQCDNNEYYVRHDFFGNSNTLGNPFLDYRCDSKNLSANSIIYGHSTKSVDKMFNKLQVYKNNNSVSKYHIINYNTLYDEYEWKVFAVMITNTDAEKGEVFNYLRTDFTSQAEYEAFIAECRARSIWDIDVDVTAADKILTLSTCTFEIDGARLVVMARQARDGEDTSSAPSVTKNEDCIYYREWAEKYGGNYIDPTDVVSHTSSNNVTSNNGTTSEVQGSVEITENTFAAIDTSVYCQKNGSVKFTMPYINSYGTNVTIAKGSNPKNGSYSMVSSSLSVTYKPDSGFTGVDTFKIKIIEENLQHTAEATVTVYVGTEKATGVTLTSKATEIQCDAGETVEIPIPATVHGYSKLYYAILEYESLNAGEAEIVDGAVKYTQTTSEKRRDTIKVVVCDKNLVGDIYTITVNKGSREPSSQETVATPSKPATSQTTQSTVSRPVSSQAAVSSRAPVSSQAAVSSRAPVSSQADVSSRAPVSSQAAVSSNESVPASKASAISSTAPSETVSDVILEQQEAEQSQPVTAEPTA